MSFAVQGTAAWLSQRCGKLTASRMADAMATLKTGKPAASRFNLLKELLAERMTGDAAMHYVSPEMQHGIAYESDAKAEYEDLTGQLIQACGFVEHPSIPDFGATPDFLFSDDTTGEIKCPKTSTHLEWIMAGVVPEQHRPQILAQLACTGRKNAVFVSYDPRIKGPRRLFIREWAPEIEEIVAVELAAKDFLAELERMWDALSVAA